MHSEALKIFPIEIKKKQRIPIYSCKIQTERGPSERLLRDEKKTQIDYD